jgi:FRG domain
MLEIALEDWQHFLRKVEELERAEFASGARTAYIYRGVTRSTYGLKPSLLRLFEERGIADPVLALAIEAHAGREFIRQAHLHLSPGIFAAVERRFGEDLGPDCIHWWTLMQHHSAPTRLLDWTRSAFVAAYFAIEKDSTEDGAIWALDANELYKRVGGVRSMPSPDRFAETILSPKTSEAIWPIERPRATERIVAQQVVFTMAERILTDHGVRLAQIAGGDNQMFLRMIVGRALKPMFLARLRKMNIGANALFPGLDGLGRSTSETVRLFQWQLPQGGGSPR